MEINFVEETAPLTEQQWERIIQYYCLKCGWQLLPGLLAAKQFHKDMQKIQSSAGHSQEEFGEVSQALLAMAKEQES